jgi:peptide/nickel transport system permease protein
MHRRRPFISWILFALGILITALFIYTAFNASRISPPQESAADQAIRYVKKASGPLPTPPNEYATWGTIPFGLYHIDIFHATIWGTRSALSFSLIVTLLIFIIGVLSGAISGYLGGIYNRLIMSVTDAFIAFPVIAGVVFFRDVLYPYDPEIIKDASSLQAFLVNLNIDPVMIALICFSWMPYARITNGLVLMVKQLDYVQASRALGANPVHIIFRHIIPNTLSPSIVMAARDMGNMVLVQASFTFIGLGGGSDWGNLLVMGRHYIIGTGGNVLTYWWVFIPTTLVIILFGIGWNLIGDSINDWLNPYTL